MNNYWDSLEEALIEYENQIHPKFIEELFELINKTGRAAAVITKLERRLRNFKEIGWGEVTRKIPDVFEVLKSGDGMCSMDLSVPDLNLRVLYAISANKEVFLLCFHERKGKSSTEYEKYISVAQSRLKEFNEAKEG